MPKFKVRRDLLAKGGLTIGSSGSNVSKLAHGVTAASFPQATTVTMVTGSIAATGVSAGDTVFVTAGSLPADVFIASASATAADTISASYYNSGSATATAVNLTIQWLALSS